MGPIFGFPYPGMLSPPHRPPLSSSPPAQIVAITRNYHLCKVISWPRVFSFLSRTPAGFSLKDIDMGLHAFTPLCVAPYPRAPAPHRGPQPLSR